MSQTIAQQVWLHTNFYGNFYFLLPNNKIFSAFRLIEEGLDPITAFIGKARAALEDV